MGMKREIDIYIERVVREKKRNISGRDVVNRGEMKTSISFESLIPF